jgi:hypothetical protein
MLVELSNITMAQQVAMQLVVILSIFAAIQQCGLLICALMELLAIHL